MTDDEPRPPWRITVTLSPGGFLLWVLLLCLVIGLIGDALRALP